MSKTDQSPSGRREDLASRLEQLSPVKRRLLERQLDERLQQTTSGIMPAEDTPDSPVPLSFNQQRLWFLDRLLPNSARYNVYRAWRIEGPLDRVVLDAALQAVLDRHQVLKTRIREIDGGLVQHTDASATVCATFEDLASSPGEDREGLAIERIIEAAATPFDLSRGPFLRATLVRLAENHYILAVILHHIAADGWSCRVFRNDLTGCYEALSRGQLPGLPDLPVQYADFARYQRAAYSGERRASLLRYWRKQLSGALQPLDLPTDFPRPAVQSDRGSKLQFELGSGLSESVHEFCREHDATLFMLLTAVLKVLLHRYAGATDISIGVPIANRTRPELEDLIGCITNVNVLRTDLSGNPGFMDFLQRVKKVALEAYTYQDMPFEELLTELHPDGDLSRTPLYQVAFILQNTPDAGLHFNDASVTPIRISNGTSKFDLSLTIHNKHGKLTGFWEYCTDLFEHATIERLAEHYRILLASVLAEPDLPISSKRGRRD